MFEIVTAGGIVMVPIILCSILAVGLRSSGCGRCVSSASCPPS